MRIAAAVLLTLAFATAGCDDRPKDLRGLHHSIVSASDANGPGGPEAIITINHDGGFDQSYWLPTFGGTSAHLVSDISKYWPGKYAAVTVFGNAKTIDKLGNATWKPTFALRFEGDALQANLANLGPYGMLNNWAQPYNIEQIGIRSIAAGCQDHAQAQHFTSFCERALVVLQQTAR